MGVELVEGHDLRVVGGHIAMRTTEGYKVIDVLYCRDDDEYLDPLNFKPESMLGVPGIRMFTALGTSQLTMRRAQGLQTIKRFIPICPRLLNFILAKRQS